MSLQLAAQHLASRGRGPDDTLVHMSRNEVKSLNDLAMAHGGQLSINPQTGLPEAGFLSSLLPMVAGAALTATTGLPAWQIGALVGGGSYLMNPKQGLMGGLMAGLGAYGGAQLGAGLGNIATSEAGTTAANEATQAAAKAEADAISARNLEMANQQVGQKAAENSLLGRTDLTRAQIENTLMPANQLQPLTPEQIQPIRDNAMLQSMASAPPAPSGLSGMYKGAESLVTDPTADKFKTLGGGSYMGLAKTGLAAAAPAIAATPTLNMPNISTAQKQQVVPHYRFEPGMAKPTPVAGATGVENTYFPGSRYVPVSNEEASRLYPGYPAAAAAGGGLMDSDPNLMQVRSFDPVVRMAEGGIPKYGFGGFLGDSLARMGSAIGHIGKSDSGGEAEGWAQLERSFGMQRPQAPVSGPAQYTYDPETQQYQEMATGGISDAHYNLGGYSDGGRLLRGPGDGVSDSIPATIGKKQPARLADGEFVVPARIVSELGNGSTEAGARKLYAMMDRVQAARKNTVGKGKVARNSRADKYLPA